MGQKADRIVLEQTSYQNISSWEKGEKSQALTAFKQSCVAFAKQPPTAPVRIGNLTSRIQKWQQLCEKARMVDVSNPQAVRQFFEQGFTPYLVKNNSTETGLFTGYYEPVLRGSRSRHGIYQEPIYRLPPDFVPGKTYYRRDEINRGILAGKGLELVYADDPVAVFFLHVQGSGRMLLDDGTVLRLGYAGKNNAPYVAIGKYMKEKGYIAPDAVSAETIKQWLHTHKDQAQYVMEQNPSYVFFRILEEKNGGPIGGQGIPLTAGASLAVDKQFIPYGTPLWLKTTLPRGETFNQLMVAQDTGTAIKGPVRGDIFFGYGKEAEYNAGLMKQQGQYVALWPRG